MTRLNSCAEFASPGVPFPSPVVPVLSLGVRLPSPRVSFSSPGRPAAPRFKGGKVVADALADLRITKAGAAKTLGLGRGHLHDPRAPLGRTLTFDWRAAALRSEPPPIETDRSSGPIEIRSASGSAGLPWPTACQSDRARSKAPTATSPSNASNVPAPGGVSNTPNPCSLRIVRINGDRDAYWTKLVNKPRLRPTSTGRRPHRTPQPDCITLVRAPGSPPGRPRTGHPAGRRL